MSAALPDAAVLRALAQVAAQQTLPLFRSGLGVDDKRTAGGFDPVTEADRAAERALRAQILSLYPDDGVIGEEYGATAAHARRVWVIDPVDGTRAFMSGLPVWGTLVGLLVDGVAVRGFMSQPFTGELFLADGEGAWLEHAGTRRRLSTRRGVGLAEATLFTTTPALFTGALGPAFAALERSVRLSRYGCDCYAFALLAAGHIDLVVEAGLQSYDIAGLTPLIEAAGGRLTTLEGGRPEAGGTIVAAGSAELHAAALAVLRG